MLHYFVSLGHSVRFVSQDGFGRRHGIYVIGVRIMPNVKPQKGKSCDELTGPLGSSARIQVATRIDCDQKNALLPIIRIFGIRFQH